MDHGARTLNFRRLYLHRITSTVISWACLRQWRFTEDVWWFHLWQVKRLACKGLEIIFLAVWWAHLLNSAAPVFFFWVSTWSQIVFTVWKSMQLSVMLACASCAQTKVAGEEELNPCMSPCPWSWSPVRAPARLTPATRENWKICCLNVMHKLHIFMWICIYIYIYRIQDSDAIASCFLISPLSIISCADTIACEQMIREIFRSENLRMPDRSIKKDRSSRRVNAYRPTAALYASLLSDGNLFS